jgi:hypothetical protein
MVALQHRLLTAGPWSDPPAGCCWAPRWAACTDGCGATRIRRSWTRSCRWPARRRPSSAATASGARRSWIRSGTTRLSRAASTRSRP